MPAGPSSEFMIWPAALRELAGRIAAGQLRGPEAFEALVDLIVAQETPADAEPHLVAQIRDQTVLGVSQDRDLCALLYQPRPSRSSTVHVNHRFGVAERHSPPAGTRRPGTASRPPPRRGPATRPRAAASAPDEDDIAAAYLVRRRRRQLLTSGGVVVALALGVLAWTMASGGPCVDLAQELCLRAAEGSCQAVDVRVALRREGATDERCAAALDRASDAAARVDSKRASKVYASTVVEVLGFDPHGGDGESEPIAADPLPPSTLTVVTGQANMTSLFADGQHLYWTVSQPPGVLRVSKLGGTAERLASHPDPIGVIATQDFVYWLSRGPEASTIWVDRKRGQHEPVPVELPPEYRPISVAFMGGEFAFVDGPTGAVVLAAVEGGVPTPLSPAQEPAPTAIATTASHVVWSLPGPTGSLMGWRRTMPGEKPQVLASATGELRRLVTDETHVYAIAGASIVAVPTDGGTLQILAKNQAGATDLTVDGDRVYWTDGPGGTVMSVPKRGGDAAIVATGQTTPARVVVDGAAVYWDTGGAVIRQPK